MCEYCGERHIRFGHMANLICEKPYGGDGEVATYIRFDKVGDPYMLTTAMFSTGLREFFYEKQINYCPICGRKLEAKPCADLDDC